MLFALLRRLLAYCFSTATSPNALRAPGPAWWAPQRPQSPTPGPLGARRVADPRRDRFLAAAPKASACSSFPSFLSSGRVSGVSWSPRSPPRPRPLGRGPAQAPPPPRRPALGRTQEPHGGAGHSQPVGGATRVVAVMPGAHVGEEKHRAGALRLHLQALGRAAAQPAGDPGQGGTGAGPPRGAEPRPPLPPPSWLAGDSRHLRPLPPTPLPGTSPLPPRAPVVSQALLHPSPSGLPKLPAGPSASTLSLPGATGLRRSAPRRPRSPAGAQRIPSSVLGSGDSATSRMHRPPRRPRSRGAPSARGPAPRSCPHSLSSLYHWKSAGGTAMASQRRRAARPRAVRALVTSVMVGGSGEARGSVDSPSQAQTKGPCPPAPPPSVPGAQVPRPLLTRPLFLGDPGPPPFRAQRQGAHS